MPIDTDISVAANGDVRYVGDAHGGASPGYYTVLELHRFLQDLADDAVASGDDLLDITDVTPSDRSTDNIVALLSPFNIDATLAEHLYDGSVTQLGGDEVYSGLVVVGSTPVGTQLQIVQNNTLLTNYWTTGLNVDVANSILLRILVKTRAAGVDIDGKRLRVQARELGDTYAEFSLTAGLGNATAAIFTSTDLNNQTSEATIAGWASIVNVEGLNLLDVSGDGTDEQYYSAWDLGVQGINDLYERTKWIAMRGTLQTTHGMNGELFRGITHEIQFTDTSGVFTQAENETVTFSNGATGAILASDDTANRFWIQLLTGTTPIATNTFTTDGTGVKVGTVTGVVTRTVSPEFIGASTGSALIGAYGIGVDPADLTASDKLFDLDNNQITPPNNVQFSVQGLIVGEDRVLVGPEAAGVIEVAQLTLSSALVGGETTVTVNEVIPSDTPASGTVRIFDGSTYVRVTYTAWSGSSFTGCAGVPAASINANTFISYVDILATATSQSFTSVYSADRSLFIRVRDGGVTPIKTFETTSTLGSAGGSVTVIRTSDA